MTYYPEHDFRELVGYSKPQLLAEYADTATQLANLHEEIANLRADDARDGNRAGSPDRHRKEGTRDALIEKKFLIARLLDNA